MSTDAWSDDRDDPYRRYSTAVTITGVHATDCPVCLAGGVCGRADQLMDDEYRAYSDLSGDDQAAARLLHPTWP